jgi:predicted RND superfamily exporter protein
MATEKTHLKLLKADGSQGLDANPIGRRSSAEKGLNPFFLKILSRLPSSSKSVKLLSCLLGILLFSLTAFGVYYLPRLNMNYSVEQFFPAAHPLIAESNKIRQTFYLEERSGFLVILELPSTVASSWLEPKAVHILDKVTDGLKDNPRIRRIISLNKIQGVFEQDEAITVGPIFENLKPEDWPAYVKNQPVIQSQIISADHKSTLMILEPQRLSPEQLSTLSDDLEKTIRALAPEVKIQVGGIPAIQGRFASRLHDELNIYFALSLLSFCLIFSFLIKGKRSLAMTLIALVVANLSILGGIAFLGIPFSVLLTTLPVITSIVVASLLIHSLHRWAEKIQEQSALRGRGFKDFTRAEKFRDSIEVLLEMALANFLGSLTTAIGFLVLARSIVPLIREYAWTISLSVMASWLIMQILLVGFMQFTDPKLRPWTMQKSLWTIPLLRWAKPAFYSVLVITLGLAMFGPGVNFSTRLFDDLPAGEPARVITESIDEHFGGISGYDLVIEGKEPGLFRTMESMRKVDELTRRVRGLSQVGSALSFADLTGTKPPTTTPALAELMFMYSMSTPNPMGNFITDSGDKTRIAVRFHDLPGGEIFDARARIRAWAQSAFPGAAVKEAGVSVKTHTINREVSKALIFGFWESLMLIGVLIVVIFRSLRWGLVACLPNVIPPAILIGALALAQTPIKPGVALIFSIALGLAFNNTVYLLTRLKKMKVEKKLSHLPLRQALLQEGNPCLFETLVMFFGFMIFLTSDFQVNQTFGIYMLLSIVAGFVGDLVFLPSLLKLFPAVLLGRKKTSSLSSESEVLELEASEGLDGEDADETPAGSVAAALALILALGMAAPRAEAKANATSEAEAVLQKVRSKLEAKDDQAKVTMIIREPNGENKERVMNLSTMKDDKFHALVRILSPADVKGTSLLAEVSPEEENQWLYVPSTKKVRRVVGGGNKNAGVLGSELTMEDINSGAIKSAKVSVKSKNKQFILIEILPKAGTSDYSKVLTSVSAKEFVPLKTAYYKDNKIAKTVEFSKYTKVGGDIWRAQEIKVKNLENHRGTDLILSQLKANSGLSSDEFSVNALKTD